MPANYVLLERIELNASAASVTFSSIPQTGYTDLKVVISARDGSYGAALATAYMTFNGTSTNYSGKYLFNNSGTAGSANNGTSNIYIANIPGNTGTASTFSNAEIYIPNYTSSNYKSVSVDCVPEQNSTTTYMTLLAGLWSNSAAITSITFTSDGNLAPYSTFSLYGLAAVGTTPAIAPKASGGNITTDGTYWIHTFLASGTFTPQTALSCDYLVVAGGGAGGSKGEWGAGGGAGGLRSTVTATGGGGSLESPLSLSATNYTVTIGAGAAGKTTAGTGSQGSNSVFASITSTGGGGGGGITRSPDTVNSPTTGGSGGGGEVLPPAFSGSNLGASGTTNQGYAGGNGYTGTVYNYSNGGGGGGAGAVGQNGGQGTPSASPAAPSGNGGNGVTVAITGSSVVYGGGGGGGAYLATRNPSGGTGGGGQGGTSSVNGSNGTANTGGGGGGGGSTSTGAGGSGIVIIRYPIA